MLQMFDTVLWYRVSLEDLVDEVAVVAPPQLFDALADVRRERWYGKQRAYFFVFLECAEQDTSKSLCYL